MGLYLEFEPNDSSEVFLTSGWERLTVKTTPRPEESPGTFKETLWTNDGPQEKGDSVWTDCDVDMEDG